MKIIVIVFFAILSIFISSCSKSEPCSNCACFNFVEPLRFSYLNQEGEDLIQNSSVVIDSILAKPIIDDTLSEDYQPVAYEKKYEVITGSPTKYHFYDINIEEFAVITDSKVIGTDLNHRCLIYRNSSIVDTLEFRYTQKVVEGEICCYCTGFPYDYIKYNGQIISEGTESGAIIRL